MAHRRGLSVDASQPTEETRISFRNTKYHEAARSGHTSKAMPAVATSRPMESSD